MCKSLGWTSQWVGHHTTLSTNERHNGLGHATSGRVSFLRPGVATGLASALHEMIRILIPLIVVAQSLSVYMYIQTYDAWYVHISTAKKHFVCKKKNT